MKTFSKLFYTIAITLTCCFASRAMAKEDPSPIKHLNFSLWSEYKRNEFEGLSQVEKTKKLQSIFKDKLTFVRKHGIRRLIVKILNPLEFEFFHPEKFSPVEEDNFYFWAIQLANHVQVEALFDCSEFRLENESIFDRLAGGYARLRDYFGKQEKPFGAFQNIIEKMEWLACINEAYDARTKNRGLISGVTLDPIGIGNSEAYYQNLVNAFDQFRHQTQNGSCIPDWIPENSFIHLKTAMLLPLDMKDFAVANIGSFPLIASMRSYSDNSQLGLNLPQNFPSDYPNFEPPAWRSASITKPLLDTVYLNMADPRLISSIYQNYKVLPHPDQKNSSKTSGTLCEEMQKVFHGRPFVKGPGYISNESSSSLVRGSYTFFYTGSSKGEGQFCSGSYIEIRPPYVTETVLRKVTGSPQSNKEMTISSPFSTTKSFEQVEYWLCPIPCNWLRPKMSSETKSRIYFVYSTGYESENDKFFGNWSLQNFLNFLESYPSNAGFIHRSLFANLNGKFTPPDNNLVLYDFSTIPNGSQFPQVNWNLGNQNH